jgi:hypothetical protein
MKLAFVAILGAAACGSSNPGAGDDSTAPDGGVSSRMEPWHVGDDWTYKITDGASGSVITGHTTVMAYEDVGGAFAGTMAFKVSSQKYMSSTTSWEAYAGDKGVRYQQDDYDASGTMVDHVEDQPYRLKVDQTPDHMAANAAYDEMYNETTTPPGTLKAKTQDWTVVSMDEKVTVPAGTYTTVHLHRVDPSNAKFKDYWFASGVGKIKESGGNELEELMAFTPAQ